MIYKFTYTIFFLAAFLIFSPIHAENPNLHSEIIIKEGSAIITSHDIKMILLNMTPTQREKTLSSKEKLKSLLLDLIILRKRANEARNRKLQDNDLEIWKIHNSTDQILSEALIREFEKSIKIPSKIELLAKEYYENHPERFTFKETIKVAHILISNKANKNKCDSNNALIKNENRKKAETILSKIKNGLEFRAAAKKYSDDTTNSNKGGELPYFGKGKMVKPFENAAFKLTRNGDISGIVETRFGYHIIKRLSFRPKRITTYENIKKKLIKNEINKYIGIKSSEYSSRFNNVPSETQVNTPAFDRIFSESTSKKP